MKFHIPKDYRLTSEYRKLESWHSAEIAAHLYLSLFGELAIQCEDHGMSGYFLKSEEAHFLDSIGDTSAIEKLIGCGLLKDSPDPLYWLCRQFRRENPELDHDYRPAGGGKFRRFIDMNKSRGIYSDLNKSLADTLSEDHWQVDGMRITPDSMNRCLVLIRTIDLILDRMRRGPDEFTVGMIQSTYAITRQFSDEKIESVLALIHDCLQSKKEHKIPRRTEIILERWGDVMASVLTEDLRKAMTL